MTTDTFITNLAEGIADIPADSIVSRTLMGNADVKSVLFGFAPGQELFILPTYSAMLDIRGIIRGERIL